MNRRTMIVAGMVLSVVAGLGCNNQTKQATPAPAPQPQAASQPAQPQSIVSELQPMPVPPNALKINAEKAWQYNKEIVGFGSRAVNSEGHKKVENYLKTKLKNDNLEIDEFTSNSPIGQFTGRNYIAKFPGKKDGIIVIAGHYDTLYNRPKFVGANDGGASTALPLAIADVLRGKPNEGYSIWLLWTDAEEAFVDWNKNDDNLYGTKHLAQKWQQDGTAAKIKAFILVDMLGDADLDVDEDANSTPELRKVVYQAAKNLGYQSHFFQRMNAFEDDHRPFGKIGVPVVDILDIDYGYNGSLHHSDEDTLDKESPKSLGISGDIVLEAVRLLNQH